MSFVSALNTGQLPEKPWRTEAVARLGVSVVIGILIGAVVTMVIQYFGTPQTSSVSEFLLLATVAFASYVAAIVILSRPWPVEPEIVRLIILLALIYLGFFFTWAAGRLIKGNAEMRNPVIAML